MPRGPRSDYPGAWHHLMNRGIARRTVFEDRNCVRMFLACLARVVRKGQLELHAYCVMTNHFHLLVRSPEGKLASAMQESQNRYVRWFNRRCRRDGPLFRGRYRSRLVESLQYRRLLVGYIDQNPVHAHLAEHPWQYHYGSARSFTSGNIPKWLTRHWIERDAIHCAGARGFTGEVYQQAYGVPLSDETRALIEAMALHPEQPDPLRDFCSTAPPRVADWMRRKAQLADGTRPGLPCASGHSIRVRCAQERSRSPQWTLQRGKTLVDAWPILTTGLLRDLASQTWLQIARDTGCNESSARRRHRTHRAWLESDAEYQHVLGAIASEVLGQQLTERGEP